MAATETLNGPARELDKLYRNHAAEVYRYAYAVLGNKADAEDIAQTTFVNALGALERGERPRKPANWLITIAHNLIRNRFRHQQSHPREVELDRDVASLEADGDDPSIDDLVRALQRIPASQREALVLREMEGRSYKEIGEILGVSQGALEALIFRARRSLAEELENLVTCDRAELALSQESDRRLGRKERKRLVAHLEECTSCARVAVLGMKSRRAFKGLALLPLPVSLMLFKGAPSASAAIGGGAAVGGAATVGIGAKIAIGLATVAVAGGAGYEGVKAVREPAAPAKATPAAVVPATARAPATQSVSKATPVANGKSPKGERGRSATAPGQTKPPKAKPPVVRGKSATAKIRPRPVRAPRAKGPKI